mmetsp:Transcript_1235/g.3586  ORF Transcript_1235/g.3586 Transcript_1235/m.3586 type:complete len:144 (+) Transcript_1235:83-514(+)
MLTDFFCRLSPFNGRLPQEPWLVGLFAFETLLLLMVLVFRKSTWFQTVVFFFCAGSVKMAESINSFLASRWTDFATQPYFDPRGVFISAVMSAPLMLIMFVVLINYLLSSVSLLVDMKAKEIKFKARQRAREQQSASNSKKDE